MSMSRVSKAIDTRATPKPETLCVKTAKKIIELRDVRGGFSNLSELMDVKGIGEIKFNKIKKFLYIE